MAALLLSLVSQADGRLDEMRRMEGLVTGLTVRASASPRLMCVIGEGSRADLQVVVRLEIENKRDKPIVLARQPEDPAAVKVALTAEDGKRGLLVAGPMNILPLSSDDPSIPRLANVEEPDLTSFVRLLPGERHQFDVVALVTVFMGGEQRSSVAPGGHYFLEFLIRFWPFHAAKVEDVRRLRETWRPYGELITGNVSSTWTPLDVPRIDTVTEGCSMPPWPPS